MFLAVPLKKEDIKDVFFMQLHFAIELNMVSSFQITNEELLQHFNDKLFNCFVICTTNSPYKRPFASIVYTEDYSIECGHGYYVDSFFVIKGLRDQKLGHLLMSRLCDEVRDMNYNYIKIYFLNTYKLHQLYSKMGFCNETLYDKKLNILEVYGQNHLEKFLTMKSHPTECTLQTDVVTSPIISTIGRSNVMMVNVFQTHTNKFAGFTEQLSCCGWVGPMVLFKDFVGNTNILDVNLFKIRLRERQTTGPKPVGIWFEIPESQITLINNLELFEVRNITKLEGWQVGHLYRYGTNDFNYFLHAFPSRGSVKCGELDRLEELYKNIYFC